MVVVWENNQGERKGKKNQQREVDGSEGRKEKLRSSFTRRWLTHRSGKVCLQGISRPVKDRDLSWNVSGWAEEYQQTRGKDSPIFFLATIIALSKPSFTHFSIFTHTNACHCDSWQHKLCQPLLGLMTPVTRGRRGPFCGELFVRQPEVTWLLLSTL